MPTGPRGEKRPADAIGAAIMLARIATHEVAENPVKKSGRTRSGYAGARAGAENLSPKRRKKIAQKAVAYCWKNK